MRKNFQRLRKQKEIDGSIQRPGDQKRVQGKPSSADAICIAEEAEQGDLDGDKGEFPRCFADLIEPRYPDVFVEKHHIRVKSGADQ